MFTKNINLVPEHFKFEKDNIFVEDQLLVSTELIHETFEFSSLHDL